MFTFALTISRPITQDVGHHARLISIVSKVDTEKRDFRQT